MMDTTWAWITVGPTAASLFLLAFLALLAIGLRGSHEVPRRRKGLWLFVLAVVAMAAFPVAAGARPRAASTESLRRAAVSAGGLSIREGRVAIAHYERGLDPYIPKCRHYHKGVRCDLWVEVEIGFEPGPICREEVPPVCEPAPEAPEPIFERIVWEDTAHIDHGHVKVREGEPRYAPLPEVH